MKTAEDFADLYYRNHWDGSREYTLVQAIKEYGAQVREEAAEIAAKQIGSTRHEIAAAIRKMELP